MTKNITITNFKGGVGKNTLTISLIRGAWTSAPFPSIRCPLLKQFIPELLGEVLLPVQSNIAVLEVTNG